MVMGSVPAKYLRVECVFISKTAKAVKIEFEIDGIAEQIWVPRSVIHGGSERDIDNIPLVLSDAWEPKIEVWFCEKNDVSGVRV